MIHQGPERNNRNQREKKVENGRRCGKLLTPQLAHTKQTAKPETCSIQTMKNMTNGATLIKKGAAEFHILSP